MPRFKEIRGTFCFVCTWSILALLIYLPLWSGSRGKAKVTKVQTKQKVPRISLSRLALHMIWAWPMELLLISLFLQKFSLIVKWLVIWIITIWWNISKCCLVMRCFSKKLGKVVFLEFLDEIQSFPFKGNIKFTLWF